MKEIIDRKIGELIEGTDSEEDEIDERDNQMLKIDDDDTKTNTPSCDQSNSQELLDERKSFSSPSRHSETPSSN
jgi:hypothetical protein